MKIVDADGAELPWDGKASGELMVRGPWVIAEYFKGEGGDPLVADDARPRLVPDRRRRDASTPTASCRSPTARKDVIKSGGEWIGSIDLENIAMAHPGGGDGGLHRRPAREVGRAAAAGGGEEARRRARRATS